MKNIDNIQLVSAEYLSAHIVRFVFNDGKINEVDFYPFIVKSTNPMITKYLDLNLFIKFKTNKFGEIFWNKNEMSFNFFTLYYGFKRGITMEKKYDKLNNYHITSVIL
jgi:hypothetical protein